MKIVCIKIRLLPYLQNLPTWVLKCSESGIHGGHSRPGVYNSVVEGLSNSLKRGSRGSASYQVGGCRQEACGSHCRTIRPSALRGGDQTYRYRLSYGEVVCVGRRWNDPDGTVFKPKGLVRWTPAPLHACYQWYQPLSMTWAAYMLPLMWALIWSLEARKVHSVHDTDHIRRGRRRRYAAAADKFGVPPPPINFDRRADWQIFALKVLKNEWRATRNG